MNLVKQLKRFIKYTSPSVAPYQALFFSAALFFWAGLILADTIVPIQYKKIVDYLTSHHALGFISPELLALAGMMTFLYILYSVFFRISDFCLYKSQDPILKDIHDRTFSKLTEHSYQFFSDNFSGALVAKAKRLTRSFEVVLNEIFYGIGPAVLSIIATFIVFSFQNIWLTIFFVIWFVVYVGITIAFVIYRNPYDLKRSEADSKVTASLADAITNILTIKVFSGRDKEIDGFKRVTTEELIARLRSEKVFVIQIGLQSLAFSLLEIIGMYLALSLWSKGSISVGTLVLAQLVFANIFAHLWGLGRSISKFTEALADASEMIDIIERPIEVKDLTTSQTPAIKAGAIEFNKVNFYYHPTNPVFTDFNLTIPAGQKVGLVGSSGCGKSTLVKLILRFVDVQSGEIAIDGQRIDSITQDDLRQNIAYVPQDPSLFHRSLLENIKYGNEEATMEDVIEAAKKAYAHDFISQLPQGYDTLVGERGVKLSGGERQRVAIARAILKRAPIIILDEATSSLDTESEGFIKEAFDSLIKGRTTIVIAHRLSTIQKMDRIIVMDKGKIVEDGNHQELIKNEEIYHRFWQYQISE